MPNDKWDQQEPLPRASRKPPTTQFALDNDAHKPLHLHDHENGLKFDKNGKRIRK